MFPASKNSSEKFLGIHCSHSIRQSDRITSGRDMTTAHTAYWQVSHRDEEVVNQNIMLLVRLRGRARGNNHMQSPIIFEERKKKKEKKSKLKLPLLPTYAMPKHICRSFNEHIHIFKQETLHHNYNNNIYHFTYNKYLVAV